MRHILVIIGVGAAMAIAPAAASASSSPQVVKPQPAKPAVFKSMSVKPALVRSLVLSHRIGRLRAAEVALQTKQDGRSGETLYRLGDTGLWMQ